MTIKLGLKVATRQTITPQLANSIRLLQLDTPTLLAELEQALAENVMLERDGAEDLAADDGGVLDMDAVLSPAGPEDLREWDEHIADVRADRLPTFEADAEAPEPGLQMRLLQALREETLTGEVRAAAARVLEYVDTDGRLEMTPAAIAAEHEVPVSLIEAGLIALREQAPTGYAAVDLDECLRLQLKAAAPSMARDDALTLLDAGLLAAGRFGPEGLRRRLGFDDARFAAALKVIARLDLHPGAELAEVPAITPDLVVFRRGGRWQVELHPAARPKLGINREYERLLATSRGAGQALRGQLQDARALLRGLEMRNDTLLKTGRAILRHQFAFLSGGDAALRPLKLRDIAEVIGMHESTVSRVTTGKYVQTPLGLFELRHFFSVTLRGDEDASAARAKACLRALVDTESAASPLSDAQLTRALAAEGIHVVRRTVAKYREAMGIPTASLRRLTAVRTVARSA